MSIGAACITSFTSLSQTWVVLFSHVIFLLSLCIQNMASSFKEKFLKENSELVDLQMLSSLLSLYQLLWTVLLSPVIFLLHG